MSAQSHLHYQVPAQFSIQHAAFLRPFVWLAKGGQDLIHHPKVSLAHGLIVTGLFLLTLLITSSHAYVLAAVMSGFMLVGPIMAAGLCELSRRAEVHQHVNFDDSLSGLSRNPSALVQFASMLLGFSVLWFALSALVLMVTVGTVAPPLDQTLWRDFFSVVTPMQLALYLLVGGLLAGIVFVLSVVSVPAIIDSQITALEAIFVSLKVAAQNIPTMLVWAAILASLVILGISSFMLGMIVIYPLLGHASWHAYRDLVSNKN